MDAALLVPDTIHPADDPDARRLLHQAQGAFQKWPEGFSGFRAEVACRNGARDAHGAVVVRGEDDVAVDVPDPALRRAVEAFLRRVACERTPCFFKDADGRYPVSFAPPGGQPGRRVVVHCPPKPAAFRVDATGLLREMDRPADGSRTVTTIHEFARATPGRLLPVRLTTSWWDDALGSLLGYEVATRGDLRVDHVWLPAACRATVQQRTGDELLALAFSRHRLL